MTLNSLSSFLHGREYTGKPDNKRRAGKDCIIRGLSPINRGISPIRCPQRAKGLPQGLKIRIHTSATPEEKVRHMGTRAMNTWIQYQSPLLYRFDHVEGTAKVSSLSDAQTKVILWVACIEEDNRFRERCWQAHPRFQSQNGVGGSKRPSTVPKT